MLNFRRNTILKSESRVWRWAGILTLGWLVIFSLDSSATASGAEAESDIRIPTLNGHQFTPNGLTRDPFILTYIRNSLGIGKAVDLFVPVYENGGGEVYGLKGDLMNAILEFEYQQAVKDWVAFRAQVRIFGRLGTGTQSILSQGISANMGFEFGWMFKLAQGKKTALSGTIGVSNNSTTAVDLLGFVNGVIEGPNVPLVKTVPVARGGVGLRYAWAATELTGFNFLGDVGLGESLDRSREDEWFFKFGRRWILISRKKPCFPWGWCSVSGPIVFPIQVSRLGPRPGISC